METSRASENSLPSISSPWNFYRSPEAAAHIPGLGGKREKENIRKLVCLGRLEKGGKR
jgi:hypothetical protein